MLPAQQAGVLIGRGPWGFVNESHLNADQADLRITSVTEAQDALAPQN